MTKITLDDVANRLGVSVTTVSQALSGKGRISPATRERIMQVVEEMSYKPDQSAQSLARRRASQINVDHPRGRRLKGGCMPSAALMELLEAPEVSTLVQMEIQQMDEEGFDVSSYREGIDFEQKLSKRKLNELYHALTHAPERADFSFDEPVDLEEIRAARPEGPRETAVIFTPAALYNRVHGAWLGRAIGCVLGKPIESGWAKSKVIQYLKLADAYPLSNYIPRLLPLPAEYELNPESDGFCLGEIDGAPYDDDTDYTVLGLHILESHGLRFTPLNVATEWLGHLPFFRTYTAERVAYRNLLLNVTPPESAMMLNPAREFIGARIRADIYGMIAPGKPELAAEMAYRDASISHTKNGAYSAMMMAAMISWSYVTADLREIIQVGLSEIPANCRLAQAIADVFALYEETGDWESAYDRLILKYGEYHPVHAINNTAFMVLAMLASRGDFDEAITTAVTCGLDTDCNGANAGAVLGILYGAQNIPTRWTEPLRDTLYTTIAQWKETRISELARRTARIAASILMERA